MPNSESRACSSSMCGERGVDQLGRDVVRPQFLHDGVQDRGLADADFARDDHEAVVIHQRKAHVGDGPRMLVRHVDELGVRRQVERAAGEIEELFVHPYSFLPSAVLQRPDASISRPAGRCFARPAGLCISCRPRAISSVVERCFHTAEVECSIHSSPTIKTKTYDESASRLRAAFSCGLQSLSGAGPLPGRGRPDTGGYWFRHC